jgi:hypothetical protein
MFYFYDWGAGKKLSAPRALVQQYFATVTATIFLGLCSRDFVAPSITEWYFHVDGHARFLDG